MVHTRLQFCKWDLGIEFISLNFKFNINIITGRIPRGNMRAPRSPVLGNCQVQNQGGWKNSGCWSFPWVPSVFLATKWLISIRKTSPPTAPSRPRLCDCGRIPIIGPLSSVRVHSGSHTDWEGCRTSHWCCNFPTHNCASWHSICTRKTAPFPWSLSPKIYPL